MIPADLCLRLVHLGLADHVDVVMAREPLPEQPYLFLAGPTPEAGSPVISWRPDAIVEAALQWARRRRPRRLAVVSPDSRGGVRADCY
ncbi:hypothetical protein ACFFSW_00715 [Saccharothrix longispora]|uniref:Uncharacterized protein n=1 Tax=Saccharothrix longispora TaxID=33920 RepID=A0ABU1PWH7_9PSEU|nr:hypothetical protein [Saccharothrix longispora]MDR6594504.1 hypothetical protein [Saccharothrix longispora]